MFIQTENTPNPSTLKFIPEKNILKKGNLEFKSKIEAKNSPLAMKLFENEDVKSVFFGIDFITITKSDSVDWEIVKPDILSKIMNFLSSGLLVVNDGDISESDKVENKDKYTTVI